MPMFRLLPHQLAGPTAMDAPVAGDTVGAVSAVKVNVVYVAVVNTVKVPLYSL